MSNRLCDLCGYEIQDICLASIEHSIPVMMYAKCLDVAIEDAIRECNSPDNLRVAHSSCNKMKNSKTREEWFAQGLNNREIPCFLSVAQLQERKLRAGAASRVNKENKVGIFGMTHEQHQAAGKASSLKQKENGTGFYGLTLEQRQENGKKQSREVRVRTGLAHKANKTGLFAMSPDQKSLVGRGVGYKLLKESKGLFGMPEEAKKKARREGGKIQGARNIETGHWQRISQMVDRVAAGKRAGALAKATGRIYTIKTYESSLKGALNQRKEDKARGGRTQGFKNIQSGHLEKIRHIKNHVNRSVIVETCRFCIPQ